MFHLQLNGFVGKTYGLLLNGMIGKPANAFDWTAECYKRHLACVVEKVYITLQAEHELSMYHLDIRPSNIIVAVDDCGNVNVLVIDWGVAMASHEFFCFAAASHTLTMSYSLKGERELDQKEILTGLHYCTRTTTYMRVTYHGVSGMMITVSEFVTPTGEKR